MVKDALGLAFLDPKLAGGKIRREIALAGNAVGQHQHIQIVFLREKREKSAVGVAVFHDGGIAVLRLRHDERVVEVARHAGLHDAAVEIKVIVDRNLLRSLCAAPVHVFVGRHGAEIGFARPAAGGGDDLHHMPCQLLGALDALGGRRAGKLPAQRGFCVGFPVGLAAKEHIERDAECVRDLRQQLRVRGAAALPAGDGLPGDKERLTKILLRHADLLAAAGDVFTQLIACHGCMSSCWRFLS